MCAGHFEGEWQHVLASLNHSRTPAFGIFSQHVYDLTKMQVKSESWFPPLQDEGMVEMFGQRPQGFCIMLSGTESSG